jgi:hypothetical protein
VTDMNQPAYVRMRGDEWRLKPLTARLLEEKGVISRDWDCEANTAHNGFPDEGPCYQVVGTGEDSDEERWNAALLDKWEDA